MAEAAESDVDEEKVDHALVPFQQLDTLLSTLPERDSSNTPIVIIKKVENLQIGDSYSQTSHPAEISRGTVTLVARRKLRYHLASIYKQIGLPQVPWMEDGIDLSISNHFTELELDEDETVIPLRTIFDQEELPEKVKILIEAQPGYGKSTLCAKLAYDWASQEEYIAKFDFLFYICLQDLPECTLDTSIQTLCTSWGCDAITLKKILDKKGEETLFVLDGFDELTEEQRREVSKFLYTENTNIVLTCRSGLFKPPIKQLFRSTPIKKAFYDKKINVQGISQENIKNFIQNFSPHCNVQLILDYLETLTEDERTIFCSPLMLILLTYLASAEDIELTSILANRTELYKNLVNCVIRRNLSKEGLEDLDQFDLFNPSSEFKKTYDTMLEFGKCALEKMMKNEFWFDDNKLAKQIHTLGFLSLETRGFMYRKEKVKFVPFHHTFLEFIAAWALSVEFEKEKEISWNSIKSITRIVVEHGKTSLLLPFLLNLCSHNLENICKQLHFLSYGYGFEEKDFSMIDVIDKSQLPIDHLSGCENILPFYAPLFFLTERKEKIINYGVFKGKIQHIFFMPSPEETESITYPEALYISQRSNSCLYGPILDLSLSYIKCKCLTVAEIPPDVDTYYYITHATSGTKNLMQGEMNSTFLEYFTYCKDVTLNALQCTFTEDSMQYCKEFVKLLNQLEVKELYIIFYYITTDDYQEVYNLLQNCPTTLKSLHLIHRNAFPLVVNVDDLTHKGERSFRFLALHGNIIIKSTERSMGQSNIEVLSLNLYCGESDDDLFAMDNSVCDHNLPLCSTLQCEQSFLFCIFESNVMTSNWFESVKELTILTSVDLDMKKFWKNVTQFTALKKLECLFTQVSISDTALIEAIIDCVKSSHLQEFVVNIPENCNSQILFLIQKLGEMLGAENNVQKLHALTISITEDETSEVDPLFGTVVKAMMELIENKSLSELGIRSFRQMLRVGVVVNSFVDPSKFDIAYRFFRNMPYEDMAFHVFIGNRKPIPDGDEHNDEFLQWSGGWNPYYKMVIKLHH